jgi:hypothetical protein
MSSRYGSSSNTGWPADASGQRKRACDQHAQLKQTPTPKKGPVDVIIQKRGGSGTGRQASPDPRHPHSPEAKVQGVC